MNRNETSSDNIIRVRRLSGRVRRTNAAPVSSAIHYTQPKTPVRTAMHVPVPAHVRPAVQLKATAHKTTFTRMNLPDGDFMINYYYRRDRDGNLVPEDINLATHFERVVYDSAGGIIGSTTGELNDVVKW